MKTFSELREQKNKELDEISLSHLTKKIANSGGMKQVMKVNKADKLKKELEAMKKKLAAEAYGDEPASEDEFRMAKKQAEFIGYVAEEIEDHLEEGGNFPEWMQNMLSELHQKAMDMHSTLGSYDAEEDDEEDMNEKTLTPAEKKKREEIAKAMERDNPNMPMSKKMAIATAQAKKVAEDVKLHEKDIWSTNPTLKKNHKEVTALWNKYEALFDKAKSAVGSPDYRKLSDEMARVKSQIDKINASTLQTLKSLGEEVEIDEAARRKGPPKMQGDWLKKEREKNREHDAAMGRTATGRKKPERAMTSTQRSLAKLRGK